jgi:hypothetical protein
MSTNPEPRPRRLVPPAAAPGQANQHNQLPKSWLTEEIIVQHHPGWKWFSTPTGRMSCSEPTDPTPPFQLRLPGF